MGFDPIPVVGFECLGQAVGDESRRQRFHTAVFELTDDMLTMLTDVDHHDHEALVALDGASGHIVADARFVRTPQRSDTAELAVAVVDSWQRCGLAVELLRRLADRAAEVGVQHFTATLLADNTSTVALLEQLGGAEFTRQGPALSVDVQPDGWADDEDRDTAEPRLLSLTDVRLLPELLRVGRDMSRELIRIMTLPVAAVRQRRPGRRDVWARATDQ